MKGVNYWEFRLLCIFAGLYVVSYVIEQNAVITTATRFIIVNTILTGIVTAGMIIRKFISLSNPKVRCTLMGVPVVLFLWMVAADRPPNQDALREAYIDKLRTYEGCSYMWGGETHSGVDCSGLARTAFFEAMRSRGIAEANPRLLGIGLWNFWWHDMDTKAMLEGRSGYTKSVFTVPRLAGMDTSWLKKGDLAVVDCKEGRHVMIYYGNGQWIEANPEDLHVVVNSAPADTKRAWFTSGPVTIVRWWLLDGPR